MKDDSIKAQVAMNVAIISSNLQDFKRTEQAASEALKIFSDIGSDKLYEAECYILLSYCFRNKDDWKKVAECIENCLAKIQEETGEDQVKVDQLLGYIHNICIFGGRDLLEQNQTNKAGFFLRKAYKRTPRQFDFESSVLLAQYLLHIDEYEFCLEVLEKAIPDRAFTNDGQSTSSAACKYLAICYTSPRKICRC